MAGDGLLLKEVGVLRGLGQTHHHIASRDESSRGQTLGPHQVERAKVLALVMGQLVRVQVLTQECWVLLRLEVD